MDTYVSRLLVKFSGKCHDNIVKLPWPPVQVLKIFDVGQIDCLKLHQCLYRRGHLLMTQSESHANYALQAFPNIKDNSDSDSDTVKQSS